MKHTGWVAAAGTLAACFCPGGAAAADDAISVGGPGGAVAAKWVVGTKVNNAIGTGSFTLILAESDNSEWVKDTHSMSPPAVALPYVLGATYATRQTSSTAPGATYLAQSKVKATVLAVTANTVTWTPTPDVFSIKAVGPLLTASASASWKVTDPMDFSGLSAGDLLSVEFAPQPGGWDMSLFDPGSVSFGSASTSGAAGSSIPGYAQLLAWDLSVRSDQPGVVAVQFASNPLLGLDDAAIRAAIGARFSFDAGLNDYRFNASGFSIGASVALPQGMGSASVTTSVGAAVTAAVPEPGRVALMLAGLLAVLGRVGALTLPGRPLST